MNENVIIDRIINDFYQVSRLPMGSDDSYALLISLSYSVANMVKLLNPEVGNNLIEFIAEEATAYNELLKQPIPKGDNAFDEVAYRANFIAGLQNDLKISIVEVLGDKLVDYDLLR